MSLLRSSLARSNRLGRSPALGIVSRRTIGYQDEEAISQSKDQKEGRAANASRDAVHAAHGPTGSKPDVTSQRLANTHSSSGGFQPGQTGEQTGGHGRGENEGMGKTQDATPPSFVDAVKQKLGMGSSSSSTSSHKQQLHTSAITRLPTSDPTRLTGEQNEHNVHSEAGKPDKLPAVRESAELPSKKAGGGRAEKHPAQDSEPLGYGSAPDGLAGKNDPKSKAGSKREFHTSALRLAPEPARHSPDGLPEYAVGQYSAPPETSHVTPKQGSSQQQYKRTYVRGTPEPNSWRLGYDFIDYTTPEAFQAPLPSSAAPPSSTSTEPANPNTTEVDLEHSDLKLPPDFDTATRGQWMQKPADQEKELPPAGDEPSGGTRELREAPRGPRDAEKTTDKEMSASAPPSDSAAVAKAQEAEATGANPASSRGDKHSKEAEPAHPDDTLPDGQPETTLAAAGKASGKASGKPPRRSTRSGPAKKKE